MSDENEESIIKLALKTLEWRFHQVLMTLLHPAGKFLKFWFLLVMVVGLYNYVGVTFRCTYLFLVDLSWDSQTSIMVTLSLVDFLCDLIYFLDILLNLFRPYPSSDGLLIYNFKKTAWNYVNPKKGWFYTDFVTALPFDWIVLIQWPWLVPFFRLNRVWRLMRKFFYYFDHFESFLNVSAAKTRIVMFILLAFLMTHFVTCLWYVVSIVDGVAKTVIWTNIPNLPERNLAEIYLFAFHWCLTTMAGYGGTIPCSLLQVLYSQFVVVIGVILIVTTIGTVGSLVMNLDANATKNKQKLDEMKEYMKYRKLPPYLFSKIVQYYTFLMKARKQWDEQEIMANLPHYLRMEVALDINKHLVEKVALFKGTSRMFISSFVLNLVPRMTLPGSEIVRKGEIGREMFFISSGFVHVVSEDRKVIYAKLGEGSFFGEIALLHDTPRTATVVAGTYCDLYVLTKNSFEEIEKEYPHEVQKVREMAKQRGDETRKKREEEAQQKLSPIRSPVEKK